MEDIFPRDALCATREQQLSLTALSQNAPSIPEDVFWAEVWPQMVNALRYDNDEADASNSQR